MSATLTAATADEKPPVKPPDLWERQPGESRQAFAAFLEYRDQEPHARSLSSVGRALSKSKTLMGRWSSHWHWQKRVDAYDAHLDEVRRLKRLIEIEKTSARQIVETRLFQQALVQPALELVRRIEEKELDLEKLKLEELFKIARTAAYGYAAAGRMERLALGLGERGAWPGESPEEIEDERNRIAEVQGEVIVQIIVAVIGSDELGLEPAKQEAARKLAGARLRALTA